MAASAERTSISTSTGLRLGDRPLSFDEWRELGVRLGQLANASTWNLADWVLYGVETFPKGQRYTRALELTGFAYGHLANLAQIARGFPYERRRPDLTFEHHRVVRALPEREQELFLDRAQEYGWSSRRLREAVRAAGRRDGRRAGRAAPRATCEDPPRLARAKEVRVEKDQVIEPEVKVVPMFSSAEGGPPDAVGIIMTGAGVTDRVERERSYALSLDEGDRIGRLLLATVEMARKRQAGEQT